jgi:uncharacterized metal-binding protein YceD (DUF177 family)
MNTLTPGAAFTRVVEVQTDAALPRTVDIIATQNERTRIAEWLGIPEVKTLEAKVRLERWRARGVRVTGSISAQVVQSCVVTLEPVDEIVAAEFEWHFMPEVPAQAAKRDLELQLEELDVEVLESGKIDVGAIVAEELSLSLDPHPRKPDAILEPGAPGAGGPKEKRENPFAALASLKVKDRSEGAE